MDLLQIIGVVVVGWLALSVPILAVTIAAGRADRRERQLGVVAAKPGSAAASGQQPRHFRTRRAPAAQRSVPEQRAQTAIRAAIR